MTQRETDVEGDREGNRTEREGKKIQEGEIGKNRQRRDM